MGDSNDTASLVPVIDDYIRAVEPVHDYLTRFSGLVPGDLDPALSKHHIVELKHAYLKLRYLVDAGCVFVGHGLKQDFKMINVAVPPAQIVDTVELFHFKRQRKLSLRFLASYLLKEDIQQETHDSIEDARTAVRLYHKYLEMQAAGNFQGQLLEIYRLASNTGSRERRGPTTSTSLPRIPATRLLSRRPTHSLTRPRRASASPRRWATTGTRAAGTETNAKERRGSEASSPPTAGCPIGPPRRWNVSSRPLPTLGGLTPARSRRPTHPKTPKSGYRRRYRRRRRCPIRERRRRGG